MQMKSIQDYPIVRPVIELGFNALKLNDSEKKLAHKIRKIATNHKYLDTPDGWFVPLADLQNEIGTVAEFLSHETLHYGEFEIGGGFEILVAPHESLGIPVDSTFRFAMDLAETIINIEKDEKRRVAAGAQENWDISTDSISGTFMILIKRRKELAFRIPVVPLQEQFQAAKLQLVTFATQLEDALRAYKGIQFTPNQLRFMLGIDKVI
jgi:hypothetical protein